MASSSSATAGPSTPPSHTAHAAPSYYAAPAAALQRDDDEGLASSCSSARTGAHSSESSAPAPQPQLAAGAEGQQQLQSPRLGARVSHAPGVGGCEGGSGGGALALGAALTQTRSSGGPEYIEWAPDDKANPFNWSNARRISIVVCAMSFSCTTAMNATGYGSVQRDVIRETGTTLEIFLLGNTTYLTIGVAFTPLLLAPLSEIYGRRPIYLAAAAVFAIMFVPQATAQNITAILVSRLIQGCAASVGNSMVGGSVSDVFLPNERGMPMSLFCLLIFIGQALGPFTASYTVAGPAGWRWVFWWQAIIALASFVWMFFALEETRGPVLLSRRAARLSKETGKAMRTRADDERSSFAHAVKISLSRPAVWLVTEPIVLSFSLWIGFLWGVLFLLLQSVPIVFSAYNWTDPQKSLVLLCFAVGGVLGFVCHLHQERLYNRAVARAAPAKVAPEARLYWSCIGAIMAPASMFWFAWSGQASVHPAVPIIALIVFIAAIFPIYLAVFLYIAEVYERYASSGLAAQSWLRNVFAGTLILAAPSMYGKLGPPVASSILGGIAAILGICPFVLFRFGAHIRKHSRVAQGLAREDEEEREMQMLDKERRERHSRRKEEKEQREEKREEQRESQRKEEEKNVEIA